MAKIFVHVGLPKTATTTLQSELFPHTGEWNVKYLGTVQPRTLEQSAQYLNIVQAINSGIIENSRDEIEQILANGQSLLFSEEMTLVSQAGVDWRTKLKNLASLLKGLDYTLIVTVREPVSAMFSYYVELYSQFSKEKKSFLELAKHDPRMEIFHYNKLFNEISYRFDIDRVFVKQFEEIIANDLNDLCELISPQSDLNSRFELKKANAKKSTVTYIYTGKTLTVAGLLSRIVGKIGMGESGFIAHVRQYAKPLVKILNSISIGEMKVAALTETDRQELKRFIKNESNILSRLYGINYE